jgi:hypothetical protein
MTGRPLQRVGVGENVAAAMEQVGMFTPNGLKAVSDIWGSLQYKDREDHHDGAKLTEQMLTRLYSEGLILSTERMRTSTSSFAIGKSPCTISISRSFKFRLENSKPNKSECYGLCSDRRRTHNNRIRTRRRRARSAGRAVQVGFVALAVHAPSFTRVSVEPSTFLAGQT